MRRQVRPATIGTMRYLVTARVRAGREAALLRAIENGSLGRGSVAGDEYARDMELARAVAGPRGRPAGEDRKGTAPVAAEGAAKWVEVCFCDTPLAEERPYWEEYFELVRVQDAHSRKRCRDLSGEEPWACAECDCTARLEERMGGWGEPFLARLRRQVAGNGSA
jgi:hypothetical protein